MPARNRKCDKNPKWSLASCPGFCVLKSLEFSGRPWDAYFLFRIHIWKSANMAHFSVVHKKPSGLSCTRSSPSTACPGGQSPCDQSSKAAAGDLLPLHLHKAFPNRKMVFGINKVVIWGTKLSLKFPLWPKKSRRKNVQV